MHFYACPYCDPCKESRLKTVQAKDVNCKYEREEVCEEKHKCKEIMRCLKCKSEFKITKLFLKEWKRKIKDG